MTQYTPGRWLVHAFAVFATVCTFILLVSGGLVTSHNAGMAVPDWPNTYGYNMFLFPVSRWVGDIFYEHSHRLIASGVGLLSIFLAIGLFKVDSRRWVRVLGIAAFVGVVIQGVLGGLRVTENNQNIGIFHGMLAQSIFVLFGIIVAVTSRKFVEGRWAPAINTSGIRGLAFALVAVTFVQLAIAATMRHAHAGLSIPDFPLAYGKLLPDASAAALNRINDMRLEDGQAPTTAALIWLQMAHRGVAAVIAVLTFVLLAKCRSLRNLPAGARFTAVALAGLIVVQISLGAWTIWSNKAADVTTAHHAVGALFLFVAARLAFQFAAMNHARLQAPQKTPTEPHLATA